MKEVLNNKWHWAALACTFAMATLVVSAHGNDHGEAKASVGSGQVSVEYHSPKANGRDLLSMVKPGIYWRIGADSPTTLTTDVDLVFGGTRITKGTYVLSAHFTSAKDWSLVISTGPGRRGAAPEEILAEVAGALGDTGSVVEEMKITIDGQGSKRTLVIDWGTRRLSAPFEAA